MHQEFDKGGQFLGHGRGEILNLLRLGNRRPNPIQEVLLGANGEYYWHILGDQCRSKIRYVM